MRADIWLGVVTVLMAVLGGIVSAHAPAKLWHKVAYVAAFVLAGAASVWLIIKISNENAAASTGLSIALKNLETSTTNIANMTVRNTELQNRLLSQSATISKLSEQGISIATGGNSFCYAMFQKPLLVAGNMMAMLHGKYPLHDVDMRVLDMDVWYAANPNQVLNPDAGSFRKRLPTFPPKTAQPIGVFSLGTTDRKDFNVFFIAVNGSWDEELRLRKVNGVWLEALRVKKLENGEKHSEYKLIYTKIDPGFPTKNGEVDWQR
jgi:hypothetical protein